MPKKTTTKELQEDLTKEILNGDYKIFNKRELARRTKRSIKGLKNNIKSVLKDIKRKVDFFDRFKEEDID